MISLIDIAIFAGVLAVILYSLYEDKNNSKWNRLATAYPKSDRKPIVPGESRLEMVFFWNSNDSKEYDYFNSFRVNVSEQGLAFVPLVNHLAAKPILIPLNEIRIVGTRRLWMRTRLVLAFEKCEINVTIMKTWEPILNQKIG